MPKCRVFLNLNLRAAVCVYLPHERFLYVFFAAGGFVCSRFAIHAIEVASSDSVRRDADGKTGNKTDDWRVVFGREHVNIQRHQ